MADVLAPPADAPAQETLPRGAGPVIQGGLATTFVTLAGLFLLGHNDVDFNPMGWYLWFVVPAGAILVGLAAGSGYGLVSWLRGVRVRRQLLATVLVLQLLSYVAAEYLAYRDVINRVTADAAAEGESIEDPGFLRYYHFKATHFAWQDKHGKGEGQPLGLWGYLFVGLAAVGFVGGGLIGPMATASLPYCAGCQRYMKRKRLGLIAASVPYRKVKKNDAEGQAQFQSEIDAAATAAEAHSARLIELAVAGDAEGFRTAGQSAFGPKKPTDKLPVRLSSELVHCPTCRRGWLEQFCVMGHGKEVKREKLAQVEVAAPFSDGVLTMPKA